MGKFDFNFDADFTRQLERLCNFDEIAQKILDETTPILERHVKAETAKHSTTGRVKQYKRTTKNGKTYTASRVQTGDMFNSIKPTKPKKNQYGWFTTVRPTGKDAKGVRNMEKMAHLEYGTSKESAHPVLTKALKDAEPEVTKKMQEIYDEAVKE